MIDPPSFVPNQCRSISDVAIYHLGEIEITSLIYTLLLIFYQLYVKLISHFVSYSQT